MSVEIVQRPVLLITDTICVYNLRVMFNLYINEKIQALLEPHIIKIYTDIHVMDIFMHIYMVHRILSI